MVYDFTEIDKWAAHAHLSPLVLAWTAAAVLRVVTGAATVATITGAGIVGRLIQNDTLVNRELLVLAPSSGSLILSHVNDAGFWLVKEYVGLTVGETFQILDYYKNIVFNPRLGWCSFSKRDCLEKATDSS